MNTEEKGRKKKWGKIRQTNTTHHITQHDIKVETRRNENLKEPYYPTHQAPPKTS
jgi:hypothetical protein